MSTSLSADHAAHDAPGPRVTPQRVAVLRAVAALAWALALVLAVGDDVPRTASDVPALAAVVLATYPLIDVVASVLTAGANRVLRVNAGLGVVAAVAVGVAAFGADAGATLVAFGAWATLSGALQLAVAVRRRAAGRGLPLMVSGGLSTLAGLSFVAAAGRTDAQLASLAGYMAFGAVLFVVWAVRSRAARAGA